MKRIFLTEPHQWSALVARLALSIVLFPHGAQKLLGWFHGYGFNGTMKFFTGSGIPYPVALLVILIESIGSLMLFFGFATRIAALGVLGLFIGVVLKMHINNGFFMNWGGTQKGEGIEYFLLLFGLAIVLLITGGGKASADSILVPSSKNVLRNTKTSNR